MTADRHTSPGALRIPFDDWQGSLGDYFRSLAGRVDVTISGRGAYECAADMVDVHTDAQVKEWHDGYMEASRNAEHLRDALARFLGYRLDGRLDTPSDDEMVAELLRADQ